MACALAKQGHRIALIEKKPLSLSSPAQIDGRASAIAAGSIPLLDHIGLWHQLTPYANPIENIWVSDGNAPCFLQYDQKLAGQTMGYMIENHRLIQALTRTIQQSSNITLYHSTQPYTISYNAYKSILTWEDGTTITSDLVIAADGKHSKTREKAGISATSIDYQQTGIIGTIHHTHHHHHLAQERFLPTGPFAVLPLHGGYHSSLVWVENTSLASFYLAMSKEAVIPHIKKRIGHYLGEISLASHMSSYPLTLHLARQYYAQRLALIGDAAHGIHPLAGQGFNLGLRDIATLSALIHKHSQSGLDIGSTALLQHYHRSRTYDSLALVAVTDGLNRLFAIHHPLIKTLRRTGIKILEKLPSIKKRLMFHAMGHHHPL